ncbi:MAG: hypothetical protein DRJ49_05090 [Thermoprotei archaeon]|nr:MAG: hypothetical protein DRN53_03975 [Thermoprotei archaeon]RLE88381.1 MAG: hypothetical protein DRJ49_05090 [Thermoprotei archaeon]
MYEKIFRAYDIRGIYGTDITEEIAERLGVCTGYLFNNTFHIGRDSRYSSPMLAEAIIKGLRKSGTNVVDLGLVPNPVIYYSCFRRNRYGIYVTASHNPPEYNGFKFIRPDGTSFIEEYDSIRRSLALKIEESETLGSYTSEDFVDEYIANITKNIEIMKRVKIVVETFGGVANLVIPRVCNELGIEYELLHPEVRGDFYGIRPEPKGENLRLLKERVIKSRADFGVAFDGDADRAVFVDDKGREMGGSESGIVFVKYLVNKGDSIVVTPDTASALLEVIKSKGGNIIVSRIGHGFIEEAVRNSRSIIGIEQSSHFYFGYIYPFSDGILSMAKMAEIVSKLGSISSILSDVVVNPIDKFYIHAIDDRVKWAVIKRIMEMYPEGLRVSDGIKIWTKDGWVLIRASQTMPEVNIVIEAPDERTLKRVKNFYTDLVKRLIKEVR